MLKPLSVFVFGSCVTRDAFEFDDNRVFELSFYMARTSFASQSCREWKEEKVLKKISSSFQRRMVEMDMRKSLFDILEEASFDLIVVDLIDDRFDMIEYNKGCYATRSVEFMKGAEKKALSKLNHHGETYDKYWKSGFDRFISKLTSKGVLSKLRINEVYWAYESNDGKVIDGFEYSKVEKENGYLERRYEYMKEVLPSSFFIQHDRESLKADTGHKWGVSPFHYGEVFYKRFLEKLEISMNSQEL